MKQETQDLATLVWEWQSAPYALQRMSPAYDDVSYIVILPKGVTTIPYWVETLVHPGGGGDEWKARSARVSLRAASLWLSAMLRNVAPYPYLTLPEARKLARWWNGSLRKEGTHRYSVWVHFEVK